MHGISFDIAHMLAGFLVLTSFMMLYQDRLSALINALAIQALVLGCSVAWQAVIQEAPHLYITAALAIGFKGIVIPMALRRIIRQFGIAREIETVGGTGLTMLAGIGLVARALQVVLPVTAGSDAVAREDIALALSVVLLGLLMMVTRRNAVSQVVGFMSGARHEASATIAAAQRKQVVRYKVSPPNRLRNSGMLFSEAPRKP